MSEQTSDIDFETADFGDLRPMVVCIACGGQVYSAYWEVNGFVACERCQDALVRTYSGSTPLGVYLKGAGLGALAALAGAIGWFLITVFTGYQLGLVSIAIGWLVGFAVSKGTASRGGYWSQGIAVALTYFAIASPHLFVGIVQADSPRALLSGIGRGLTEPVIGESKSILGVLIMAFGLVQAWQKSRSLSISVKGPFQVGNDPAPESLP